MDRKRIVLLGLCMLFLAATKGIAQQNFTLTGTVVDSAKTPVIGAVVKISAATDSIKHSTDLNGTFIFQNLKFPQFTLTVSYIGFEPFVKKFTAANVKAASNDTIVLRTAVNALNEITISGVVPVRVKEDTVEYSAAAYPVRDGDAVEEVIKKLPGVTVDKDGNVTAQGKPVTRIRVNGKDFFGSDVATAIQSLPADIIKNLQIVDDYGDQAKLTGIKVGEPEKILNINILPDKNHGYTVRGTGGIGNEDRFITNLKGTLINGERQITFDGSVNNTNIRGGGGDGITNTKSGSLSYRNEYSKKFSLDGGGNFNQRDNTTMSTVLTQSIYQFFTRLDNQATQSASGNKSASVWTNLEFKPDTVNYLKLSPSLSYNSSDFNNNGNTNTLIRNTSSLRNNVSVNSSVNQNAGLNVFYNHKFRKKNRNVNFSANANFSTNDNDRDARNDYQNTDSLGAVTLIKQYQRTGNENDSRRYGTNITYTEPLGAATFLDLTGNWNFSDTRAGKDTRDVDPVTGNEVFNAGLSNIYRYQFITQRAGFNFRRIQPKYNFNIGLSAQPALLKGENRTRNIDTRKATFILIPTARYVYRFDKQKSLTLNYNGRSNQPSFNQLQPITDNSNLQNTLTGNPYLKPEYTHNLNLDYNQSDWKEGYNLFANLTYSRTENKIVTTKDIIPDSIKQVTSYINTNGAYNTRANYSLALPFSDRKYILTYSGGARYNNNIAYTNKQRNLAKNLVIDQGLKFHVQVKDVIDAELGTNYSRNDTRYSQASLSERKTNTFSVNLDGRNYFFQDLSLGYNLSHVVNSGYNYADVVNPTLVSVFLEYRFLKGNAANIRFQGFDLLNQNTGITRDVFDNEIVDRQTNRLARYFLMTFSMRMKKFGGK